MTVGSLRESPHVVVTETGRRIDATFGRVATPIHHADPGGPTVDVAFIRLSARSEKPGPPVVLLAGGPGGTATEWLTWDDGGWPEFIDGLRAIGDVIALDQRGTGASGPVPLALERWGLPLGQPGDRASLVAAALERSGTLRDHWHTRGVDTSAYTAAESADDIAMLVRALRVDCIRLYGISYGSHLGLAVLRRHDGLVERAVLGLVEGPDHTHKLPSVVDTAFEHVANMAAAAPEFDGRVPDLVGLTRELRTRLLARPMIDVRHEAPTVLGWYDLQRAITDCLGSQDDIAALPERLAMLLAGDVAWLGAVTHKRRTDWFPDAMFLHTDAASGASPARRARLAAEAETSLLGDAINGPFPDVEAAWGYPDLGEAFRSPLSSDVAVQFYSGLLDGRTPRSNVEELIGGFSTSGHLLIDGIAHDDGLISGGVRARLLAFLADGQPGWARETVPFRFSQLGR